MKNRTFKIEYKRTLTRTRWIFALLLIISSLHNVAAQSGFHFFNSNEKYQDVKFKLVNNLMIIPLQINDRELNFILDTGVNKTIVFNSAQLDSVFYQQEEVMHLRGLGQGKPVDAIISDGNRFRLDKLKSDQHKVFIILKDEFDLSKKMGITVHGVIGYEMFKNLILRINYKTKKIRFFNPKHFKYDKCRKCETLPLTLYKNKPYVDIHVTLSDSLNSKIPVKMLVDSGGSDALWLFEHSKNEIGEPQKYFEDFLGVGLSGVIMGKRSRLKEIKIGRFKIPRPTVSFLDTISTKDARRYVDRNGSIGGNILKRFKVWIDYPNRKMVLKKNGSFTSGFEYNMSGIDVVYSGELLIPIKELSVSDKYDIDKGGNVQSISLVTNYVYKFKPSFSVYDVVENSPAYIAGVRKGDIILKINDTPTYKMSLNAIQGKFQSKNNKLIRLTLQRGYDRFKVEFRLKKRI